ncbi:MAG: mechanosensitive ion channel [Verrucomicrobiota bacterium]
MNTLMTGHNFLDSLEEGVISALSGLLELIFGPTVRAKVIGPLSWADLGVMLCILLFVLIADLLVFWFLRRKRSQMASPTDSKDWRRHVLGATSKPLHLFVWFYGVDLALAPPLLKFLSSEGMQTAREVVDTLSDFGLFAVLFWLFFRLTHVLEARLATWASKTGSKLDDLVVPLLGRSLRVLIPVMGILFALPVVGLPQEYASVVAKGSSILIIGTVAWILAQGVRLGEQAALAKYDIRAADNLQARKVYTQVHVISKTLYVLIAIFTIASVLMLFEEVRRFGASILASAGVFGIIIGFAAQRTIANLFAGIQLAMTQPVRIDDVVIVEGEWGRVEEISLTYVIIHIWDDRRLVVPLSHFIEKPFQNWTRVSASLLGSVSLWTDYTLPLDQVRRAAQKIVEGSTLWDRRFWNLQVTDASECAMQIRVLATAADSSKTWDLRCEIREKLIEFIQQHHSQSLPRTRVDLDRSGNGFSHRLQPAG